MADTPRNGIARLIDQGFQQTDVEWMVPTRFAREVADRMLEAASDPRNAKRLTDRAAVRDFVGFVLRRFEAGIRPERLDETLDAIAAVVEEGLAPASSPAP